MTCIKDYILDPFYKVFFGVLSIFIILALSPFLAIATFYILFYNSNYLEYINPDLTDLNDDKEGDHD